MQGMKKTLTQWGFKASELALLGALGRIRTCNLLIRSQVLYPLSYERMFTCYTSR
jgi:hypothetical protein